MKNKIIFSVLSVLLFASCREQEIMIYDTSVPSLNILKGEFGEVEYPESYYFNAYFLGVGSQDYTMKIPVRLSGVVDADKDREYRVRINADSSEHVNVEKVINCTLNETQVFRRGLTEDSIAVTIHVSKLNERDNYKLYIELVPTEQFQEGIPKYQFVVVDFMKNVNTEPPFWTNNSKLKKFVYHPAKGAKFLEISGITDPEWEDPGNSFIMDYWISVATQWFEDNAVFDEKTGNRIYFDK